MRRSLKQKHKKILTACIAVSLFLHAVSIFLLQGQSVWFSTHQKAKDGQIDAPWLNYIEKMERDQILKEAFESPAPDGAFAANGASRPTLEPKAEAEFSLSMANSSEEREDYFSFALLQANSFKNPIPFPQNELQNKLLASNLTLASLGKLPSDRFNLSEHLPKELILSAPAPAKSPDPLLPQLLSASSEIALNAIPLLAAPSFSSQALESNPVLRVPSLNENIEKPKAPPLIPLPTIPKLPTLADLETASYSESFDAELVFLPREEGEGYIFAITLIPHADLDLPRIRQHYTFLIDKSNSIQKDRLAATKNAVHKAIEELFPDDTFNIIAFDSKVEKLSPVSLPFNKSSVASAEIFLEKIQLGSFFSAGDVYKPLLLTVPGRVENDEVHTAILLSDGESLSKKNAQRSLFFDWTSYNSGRVALFAIGMNSDPHLSTLDAAAAFNKGKLIYSPTQRGIKRKLLKLMKTIGIPVAKNLNCKAISRSPKAKIELFPRQMQLPHLYLDQPYIILGMADTLDDFILFAQGRLKNRWINIKKSISFVNAKKGGQSLKAEWALQQAYNLYGRYVYDGDAGHLAEAGKLLEPYDYQVAFQ